MKYEDFITKCTKYTSRQEISNKHLPKAHALRCELNEDGTANNDSRCDLNEVGAANNDLPKTHDSLQEFNKVDVANKHSPNAHESEAEHNIINTIDILDCKFHTPWQLWYHHHKKNWKLSGYQKIIKVTTVRDFWELYNNFDAIGGLFSQHFFIMRDGITPLWEDKQNNKGGAWSFKVHTYEAADLWLKLSGHVLGETLLNTEMVKSHNVPQCSINGLSICVKKENITIIKIWNKSSKFKSTKFLPNGLTKKYNVIYKEHCPEY